MTMVVEERSSFKRTQASAKHGGIPCFHCGQRCPDDLIAVDEKLFCCEGCKSVYEILRANDLCNYYNFDHDAGVNNKATDKSFDYLDSPDIRKKIVLFDSKNFARVVFQIPAIHCASCIWLLENLRRLNSAVMRTEVNFARRSLLIDFNPEKITLAALASLLTSVGYSPSIDIASTEKKGARPQRAMVFKLTIAGFAFGNVMLFSFPEYLGIDVHDHYLMRLFSFLNLALAMPVLFYSAWQYFESAAKSFKQKQINIDVPIAAGLAALFLRSSYDIFTATGPGYLDSFTGLVFFLLIGRWFQGKTYESLSFDRDFKSYFPLAVQRLVNGEWKPVISNEIKKNDIVRLRNMEILPVDAILLSDHAFFDFSFVTGESRPVTATCGDLVYAGGRLLGSPAELRVDRSMSQSHLTTLWNNDAFRKKDETKYQQIIDRSARVFTWIVMAIALITALRWYFTRPDQMWLVLTSVLMVACPCALALAAPFTYGSMLRAFGRHKFYLKNADVIERIASIDAVVFDKTGTVTYGCSPKVQFIGNLDEVEMRAIRSLSSCSSHPLSVLVANYLPGELMEVSDFSEEPGRGISGKVNGRTYRLGSWSFVKAKRSEDPTGAQVFVSIDDQPSGYYLIGVETRQGIKTMLDRLGKKCLALLSGDNEADKIQMQLLFNSTVQLLFNQSPHDKLAYIAALQHDGKKVMMVGDGLNDSGAFKQSDVGIAVNDKSGSFTPASDAILDGSNLQLLDRFIELSKTSSRILLMAFSISFFYNAIALTFAVTGNLTPLVAAVLMPVSSITVVGFSTLAVNYVVHRKLKSE